MAPRTYVIGRSTFADVVLADASVAPHHAELVVTERGRLHLTDGGSSAGTWRRVGDRWEPLRQAFVDPAESIRLGDYVCTPGELVGSVGAGHGRPSRGRLERDAVTGELVRRRG